MFNGKSSRKLNSVGPMQGIGLFFLVVVGVVYLVPLFWLANSSFLTESEIFQFPPKILSSPREALHLYTLDTYRAAFSQWDAAWSLGVSVVVTVGGILLTLLVCSLCAYAFAYLEFPGKGVLFIAILATMMLPMGTMIAPYLGTIRTLHLKNNLLGLIIPYAGSAFGVFLLRQFYIKIPVALIESARIDGAGHLKIWWNVIVPLSKPALAALSIVQFRTIWNDFLNPMLILGNEKLFTATVKIQVMDSQNFGKPYDAIIATGFMTALVPIVFFLVFQKQFIEGLAGGIKE
jgi:multiple sugar transport system permease protein/sn-glycerol 3-phosphate transport system permease protein